MSFITLGFVIAGLAAMSVPIIIHLLSRRRRRPIEWAAMQFLLDAYRKHKRRLQVEQLILLAVRCLILALFGLALARPVLERAGLLEVGGSRVVYLVIDDGVVTSAAATAGEDVFTQQIDRAVEIVESLEGGDAVGIVTAARPVRAVLSPPSTDRAAVLDLLKSMRPTESATDLDGAMSVLRETLDDVDVDGDRILVYLLSEYRAGSARLESPLPRLAGLEGRTRLLATPPATSTVPNVQIEAVRPARSVMLSSGSDGAGQVSVRLARQGDALGRDVTRVRLLGEAIMPLEPRVVQWQPGQSTADVEFMVRLTADDDREVPLTAVIDDDDLNADNRRHVILDLRNRLRVLLVDRRSFGFEPSLERLGAGEWIRRALEPTGDSPMEVVEVEPAALDIADIRLADVVIIPRPDLLLEDGWALLRDFVDQRGLLLLMPPGEGNVHQWTEHLATDLSLPWRVALEVEELEDAAALADEQPASELLRLLSSELGALAQPVRVYRRLPVDIEQSTVEPLLQFADGTPLLIVGTPRDEPDDAASSSDPGATRAGATTSSGMVVYLAAAPELAWTNLPSRPLMVPLLHELVRQGLSAIRSSQRYVVGVQPIMQGEAGVHEIIDETGEVIIVGEDGRLAQALSRSGVYEMRDRGSQSMGQFAVNIEPSGARTTAQGEAEVRTWLRASGPWEWVDPIDLTAAIRDAQTGSPIALYLLLGVLALVVLETMLARFFSHAYSATGSGVQSTGLLDSVRATGGAA